MKEKCSEENSSQTGKQVCNMFTDPLFSLDRGHQELVYLTQKSELDPLKSFKYHRHQHKGNTVRTSCDLFTLTSAFFIFNPGYNLPYIFFITPQGMLVLLLFLAC